METFKDVKARLVSVEEVVKLLLQKRAYSKEDDFCWKIYTEMIQNVKNLPETNQTPRQLKEELDMAVKLLKIGRESTISPVEYYNAVDSFLTSIENKRK